jgi:hypothetical protein
MPAYLPIPKGLEIPEGETFDLVTTYAVDGGQLYPLAVDGIAFPNAEEMPEEEMPEEEMPEEEMPEEEMPEGPNSFASAVEMAMKKPKM